MFGDEIVERGTYAERSKSDAAFLVDVQQNADAPRAVVPVNRSGGSESGREGVREDECVELQRCSRTAEDGM